MANKRKSKSNKVNGYSKSLFFSEFDSFNNMKELLGNVTSGDVVAEYKLVAIHKVVSPVVEFSTTEVK